MFPHPLNRRDWLRTTSGLLASAALPRTAWPADAARPKVAAILTEFTYRSHAHVILENFLKPYYFNGKLTHSGMDVVSLYVDQFPEGRDMAREVSKSYGIPIFPTIAEALCRGGDTLAVDGVLSIGEQGTYPLSDRGVIMYPRKRFFDEIIAVYRKSGRVVPLFNDKHFSYRWDWADEMMRTVRDMKIPFLAGSSVPLAERRPPLEMPAGARIEEAVSVHSGPPEIYDFHGLEVLQSMVESRRGGETGVSEVQLIEGDAVWQAAAEGRFSLSLAEAALRTEFGDSLGSLKEFVEPADGKRHPVHAILVKYRDGLRATVLRIGKVATRWCFACRIEGKDEPLATRFHVGPWNNRNLFKALSHAIQSHIREKQPPYPAERTWLTTGMLASAMESRHDTHRPQATPHLDIAYSAKDFRAFREMGATWKIITEDQPQPPGIDPGGPRPESESR